MHRLEKRHPGAFQKLPERLHSWIVVGRKMTKPKRESRRETRVIGLGCDSRMETRGYIQDLWGFPWRAVRSVALAEGLYMGVKNSQVSGVKGWYMVVQLTMTESPRREYLCKGQNKELHLEAAQFEGNVQVNMVSYGGLEFKRGLD